MAVANPETSCEDMMRKEGRRLKHKERGRTAFLAFFCAGRKEKGIEKKHQTDRHRLNFPNKRPKDYSLLGNGFFLEFMSSGKRKRVKSQASV